MPKFFFKKIFRTGSVYGSANEPGEVKANPDLLEEAFQLGQKMVAADKTIQDVE